jgi:Fe-S cluster assembly protein SufD
MAFRPFQLAVCCVKPASASCSCCPVTSPPEIEVDYGGPFESLSLALFEDGALIRVDPQSSIEQPVQLLFVDSGAQPRTTTQLQNIVLVEQGARASVIESYVALGEQQQLTNAVTQLICEADAEVDHFRVLEPSNLGVLVSALDLELHERSVCRSRGVCLTGGLVRNEIRAKLEGEQASVMLDGLFMVDGERHVDTYTLIDHAKPRCRSEQLFKGILDDKAHGIFSGKIRVALDAQQTDALQSSNNLLLSEDATINAKPQLEILADDVKCSHGATIGHLDDDALFYLRTRGIESELARALLIQAFAGEVVDRYPEGELRERLQSALSERLALSLSPEEPR